tara:strand:+ start:350 stop:1945 length:1596 start_codon:yes stop_codon:yes gene_type:complete
MANRRRKRLKNSKIPVIKKDLEDGVIAEANNDGTIYVDKDVKKGSPLEKEAIAHEMVHMDQMKRGDLDYDDNNVYWKGKKYSRAKMNEGSSKLPWEKEAYNKTDHINGSTDNTVGNTNTKDMKKSSPNKYIYTGNSTNTRLSNRTLTQRASMLNDQLRIEADKNAMIGEGVGKIQKQLYDGDFKNDKKGHHDFSNPSEGDTDTTNKNNTEITDSSNEMNQKNKNKTAFKMKATPITMKASRSALKVAPLVAMAGKALVGAAAKKVVDSAVKMKSPLHVETTSTREFSGNNQETGQYGTFTETEKTKKGKKGYEGTGKTKKQLWDMNNKNVQEKYNGDYEQYEKDADKWIEENQGTPDEVSYESTFTPDEESKTTQDPGTPGTPDRYNMGYYESMDAKYGAGVRGRGQRKVNKKAMKAGNKFDRMNKRGKTPINADTGKPYTREDYIKATAGAYKGTYDIPVGKSRRGTPGTPPGEAVTTTSDVKSKEGEANYKKINGKLTKVDADGNPIEMNKNNKKKSAFKMKGFGGFNK